VLVLVCGGFGAFAAFQEPTTPMGTSFKGMDMSGITAGELKERLQAWWDTRKSVAIAPYSPLLEVQPAPLTPSRLGIKPDWDATAERLQFESYTGKLLSQRIQGGEVQVAWTLGAADTQSLADFVKRNARKRQPAKVEFSEGVIVRTPEVTSFKLDSRSVASRALDAIQADASRFELPMIEEKPHVSRQALDSIKEVVSSFTTRFNLAQGNRSSNIRLAASKLNGHILMPGDTLSYNETVGRRLVTEGFKLAGVYRNGKHDVGIGGGICQVSTTLFNAAAFANLKIVERSNHSMPVPYVPVGRDATVDYGSKDLKIRNNADTPVAIVSEVNGGSVTFRVLGTKDPSLSVSLITTDHSSWSNSLKYVNDPTLPVGKTKVIEKGSIGRKCITWRIVRKDGEEIIRERIGASYYSPSARIVARGSALVAGAKPEPAPPDDDDNDQ
jgi:vancomycin resistance protein YoaR